MDTKKIRFFTKENGKNLGFEFYESLDEDERIAFAKLFKTMSEIGSIKNKTNFNFEGNGIYCFKHGQKRLPCFFDGKMIFITHGFVKKTQKMPAIEKDRALNIKKEYDRRKKNGELFD